MDIRSTISGLFGGGKQKQHNAAELAAMAERGAAEHAEAVRRRDEAQSVLDEVETDAELGRPVERGAVERARKHLADAVAAERALRVMLDRARTQQSATAAAEREARYEAWRASIGPDAARQADELLADAIAKAEAAGEAAAALLDHLGTIVLLAQRGRDVASDSGLDRLQAASVTALRATLAERSGGVFPPLNPMTRSALAEAAPIRDRVQAAFEALERVAGRYEGLLQPETMEATQ